MISSQDGDYGDTSVEYAYQIMIKNANKNIAIIPAIIDHSLKNIPKNVKMNMKTIVPFSVFSSILICK